MIKMIKLLLVLALGALIGIGLYYYPGSLILVIGAWRIDAPLWLALIIWMLATFLILVTIKLISALLRLPQTIKKSWLTYREKRHEKLTQQGLTFLLEGQWHLAERTLMKSTKGKWPWINYLEAAKAAIAQNEFNRAKNYLTEARQLFPEQNLAIGLMESSIYQQTGQIFENIQVLEELQQEFPKNQIIIQPLAHLYQQTQNMDKLKQMLPHLKPGFFSTDPNYNNLLRTVELAKLREAINKEDSAQVLAIWQHLPRGLEYDAEFVSIFAQFLNQNGATVKAEKVIRYALKKKWDDSLVENYAKLNGDLHTLLNHLENWLNAHPQSAELLFALGEICYRLELWGKAQRYWEISSQLSPLVKTYTALGHLMEKLNEPELSQEYFKKALTTSEIMNA